MTITTFPTMGTIVSIRSVGELGPDELGAVTAVFADYDRVFSLYRPDSELSRIADGRLRLLDSSARVREAYERSLDWRSRTGGAFTPHRPDGVLDLSGIVKALAIRDAGQLLASGAEGSWLLNCGGDVLVHRAPADSEAVAGISDPDLPGRLLTSVVLPRGRRAIATSGVSERGEHIWGPRADFDQVTAVADDIVTADVLATAILAGGRQTCDLVADVVDVDVVAVQRDGDLLITPGIRIAGVSERSAPPAAAREAAQLRR